MTASSTPPRRLRFQTTDCDRAAEYLSRIYATGIRMTGRGDRCFLRHIRMATSTFAIDTTTQTDDLAFTVEPPPTLLIARTRSTTMDYRSGGAEHRFGPGEVFLGNRAEDGDPLWARWRDGTVQAVSLPFPLLERLATETGCPAPIRFTGQVPVTPAAAHHLATTIDYLGDALRDRPQAMNEPLVAGTAGQLLAAAVLSSFPSNALTAPTVEDRHDAHPRTLGRAIAFIEDNAHRDISVADIAAASHVTVRALQLAFRRHHGSTPTGYLRQVRLHRAHRELLATDPATGATVTQIAARWGFFHPGRFAQYYRTTYGRPPSRTLLRNGS
ncbi:helix-turn-helix transcriptional regulator [Amycolatopsis anabasis]|uniref:helix-turn-helix transcriptional regulator n=1 Tax=Amycolatopsis anabasis TaxID=1840409 RepID=UPI001C551777|nr:helix-turn-helix transcriptional regulator [Amycolatopsis anabasis]